MDWSALTPLIANAPPTIGGLLGGLIPFPGGAILGQVAGKVLAEALGVTPTPEAVKNAIETGDQDVVQAKLSEAETRMQTEVEKFKAALEDVQSARAATGALAGLGSRIAWGAPVVSVVVMVGFMILSFIAMKPDLTGVRSDVTLFLLGAWSGYAGAVVTYWLGSSAGSSDKTATIAAMAVKPGLKK